jgi:DNA-binding NtrC family response regulator
MAHGTVILVGSLPIERFVLGCLASEFELAFQEVSNLQNCPNPPDDVVAVLFNPSSLGLPWDEALRSVLKTFPRAFPILCHGFADHIDWPEMADAGAFHSIPVPFSVAELRQSLGFVWGAKQASKATSRSVATKRALPTRIVAAGFVA